MQLLVGRQGAGKSTFAAWVIGQLSTGRPWPDETDRRAPLRCGMLSLEEPAERLAARLTATGADLDLVEILGHVNDRDDDGRPYQRPWRLPGDCGALEATVADLGLAVVTIELNSATPWPATPTTTPTSAPPCPPWPAWRSGPGHHRRVTHPPKGNSDAVTAAIGSTVFTGGGLLVRCDILAGARYFGHQRVPAGAAILRGGRLPGSEVGELLLGPAVPVVEGPAAGLVAEAATA